MVEDISDPDRLWDWFNEHYEMVGDPRAEEPPVTTCRRCHKPVFAITKHAVVRHGDKIRIVAFLPGQLGSRSRAMAF